MKAEAKPRTENERPAGGADVRSYASPVDFSADRLVIAPIAAVYEKVLYRQKEEDLRALAFVKRRRKKTDEQAAGAGKRTEIRQQSREAPPPTITPFPSLKTAGKDPSAQPPMQAARKI